MVGRGKGGWVLRMKSDSRGHKGGGGGGGWAGFASCGIYQDICCRARFCKRDKIHDESVTLPHTWLFSHGLLSPSKLHFEEKKKFFFLLVFNSCDFWQEYFCIYYHIVLPLLRTTRTPSIMPHRLLWILPATTTTKKKRQNRTKKKCI